MVEGNLIKNYVDTVIAACNGIEQQSVIDICNILKETVINKGRIYICGNGGSASTASHFQNDLNKVFSIINDTMPAFCLTDNIGTLTAISNDFSYDEVFQCQLRYLLGENDILIVISGSGNSKNIIKAAEYAKEKGNYVISVVGFDGGVLKKISDFCFHIKVDNMQISEDVHLMFCHLVSTVIRESGNKLND